MTKPYELHFCLTTLPKSLNITLRAHFWKKKKENDLFTTLIWSIVDDKLPPKPLERFEVSICRHFYRFLDYDGMVGSMKPVIDALIDCKVIKDDSWNSTGPWKCDQKFRPKKDGPLLEVSIKEIIDV